MENGNLNTETGEMADPAACGPALAALVGKIAAAANEIGVVGKKGHNEFQKYNYARAEDVNGAVRVALYEQGVVMTRRNLLVNLAPPEQSTDKRTTYVTLTCQYVFTDGHAEIVCDAFGEGRDTGDKAANKAQTAALKYALIQNFLLETGEDPEADESADRRAATQGPARQVTTTQRAAAPRNPVNSNPTPATASASPAPQAAPTPIPAAWGGDGGPITAEHVELLQGWIGERKQSEKAVLAWATRDAKREIAGLSDLGERQFERLAVTWGKVKNDAGEWVARK